MNQILQVKNINKTKNKTIFYLQLLYSLILIIIALFFVLKENKNTFDDEFIGTLSQKNQKISGLYNTVRLSKSYDKKYAFRLIIDKIDLDYYVFNSFSDELLKESPCKFSGGNLDENTNICIAAHNYDNKLFFGRINELKKGDTIIIKNINNDKLYEYVVFKKYQILENDFSILEKTYDKELTLLTCNNLNKKRIIVKAFFKSIL